ncbi:MAG: AAA family ATPase [Gammaproteobacteria bacterium]|nr:AAA family ATPase [Gammaproteobacteria bacterium]
MTPAFSAAERLIAGLCASTAYDHPVTAIQVIETHISWILLTGDYAYKIKKPVVFSFVDFSTLALRHYYCQEELRLNQRLAPALYLSVVSIGGSLDAPRIGATPALEFAVKMRQFKPGALADQALRDGLLNPNLMHDLAGLLTQFHRQAQRAPAMYGTPAMIIQQVSDNFAPLRIFLAKDTDGLLYLNQIESWLCRQNTSLSPRWEQRRQRGYVRECHGDLHLANIAYIHECLVPFDALEFSEALRFIDVLSDIAFLIMDLDYAAAEVFGAYLRNDYIDQTGDFDGLIILRYYQVYRALVRAKVAALRTEQLNDSLDAQRTNIAETVRRHLQLAHHYTLENRPILLIMHGLSGSGKSYIGRALAANLGAIWLRSDTVRRLPTDTTRFDTPLPSAGLDAYQPAKITETYARMRDMAHTLMETHYSVLADATFIDRDQRSAFITVAQALNIPCFILHCVASQPTLEARINARRQNGQDPSEVTVEVLYTQLARIQPLSPDEIPFTITVNTEQPVDVATLATRIRAMTRLNQ